MRVMQTQMKKVQPRVNAIRERYKKAGLTFDKRQKMNEEIMLLYKKEGINPAGQLGGCLPLLLQLPVFWAFFIMLPRAIELRQEPFILWIKDLAQPDPYYLTPLIMGATMFLSTKMTSPATTEPIQRNMLYFMPILFTVICLSAPSGLVIYWLFSNVFQMVQQTFINKATQRDEERERERIKLEKKLKRERKAQERTDHEAEKSSEPHPSRAGDSVRRSGRKRKKRRKK